MDGSVALRKLPLGQWGVLPPALEESCPQGIGVHWYRPCSVTDGGSQGLCGQVIVGLSFSHAPHSISEQHASTAAPVTDKAGSMGTPGHR